MTTFSEFIDSEIAATAGSDRRIIVAACIKAEFLSATVRLWAGLGAMITPDGERWQGWYAQGDGDDLEALIDLPALDDIRRGTSAPVTIRLGYLDAESYLRLRDEDGETDGRTLTVGYVAFAEGTTRALCLPGNATRLKMVGRPSFQEKQVRQDDGSRREQRVISVRAVNLNSGRSRIGANVFTYLGHRFRSQSLYGIASDDYAQFVARYAGGVTLEL